tara:strand:- start:3328 stop:4788 length:1461 start_codon:yes stop_codon:yes gene_type:complete
MKRDAMTRSFPNAQMSPVPTTEEERQRLLLQNRLQDVSALGAQSIAARQQAAALPAPTMIQPRQDFLTPSNKGGVMDFVKGILSSRLQSKGLRRDPLDVARQNLINRQGFDEEISALGKQAENAQALSQQMRERAILQARKAGIPVDPTLGLSSSAQIANLVSTTGADMTPSDQLALSQTGDMMSGADALRGETVKLFQSGSISRAAANSVINAADGQVSEEFSKLRTPVQLAPGIMGSRSIVDPADVQMADDITSDDLRDAKVLGFRRGDSERKLDLKARETVNKFVTEIEPKIAGNEQIFEEIMPKIFNAVLENDTLFSGRLNVFLSDSAKAVLDPEGANVQELAATIAQQSLRELLGGQFAVQENIQLINRFYNVKLPPLFNLARLRRAQKVGQSILNMNRALKERMETEGTLFSADGKNNFKYPTLEDVFASEGYGQDGLGDLLSALTDKDIKSLKNRKFSGEYQGKSVQRLLIDEIRRREI